MERFPKSARAAAMFLALALSPAARAQSQNAAPVPPPAPVPATAQSSAARPQSGTQIRSTSTVVLVPALVKTKSGDTVFSLASSDFILTDNGTPQTLRMESDNDSRPIALVIIVETGGEGADHLHDYGDLAAILDNVIGDVSHRVAVVSFDSAPHVVQEFTGNTDAAAETLANLSEGDQGAAILDALSYGINMLRRAPPAYRRAIVFFSETADNGSQTSLDDAVRAVSDTNTAIYSFGFSTTRTAVKHEASKVPLPGGTPYGETPYGPGGCMSSAPGADPDAHGSRKVQALDCASDLLPPLRLVRMAFIVAKDGLRRNVPESVANLTGGEYFPFTNASNLSRHLLTVSNDVPNYYMLSFRPESPTPGLHTLELKLKGNPDLDIKSRTTYWIDADPTTLPSTQP